MNLDGRIAKALSSSLTIKIMHVKPGSARGFSTHGLPSSWERAARDEYGDHMVEYLIYSTSDVRPDVLIGWIRHGGTTVVPRVRHGLPSIGTDQMITRKVFS